MEDSMAGPRHFDLIVIGSGSAASACWFNARQMGKSVAVFESGVLGGECPTSACVPTKALLHCADVFQTVQSAEQFGVMAPQAWFDYAAVKARKDYVVSQTLASMGEQPYREMGVEVVRHYARFVSPSEIEAGGERYTAEKFLIATGASQRIPDDVPGLEKAGFMTFKEAIDLEDVPPSMLILGAGPVGCEFTHLFSTFGSMVALMDRNPLALHNEDPEVGAMLGEVFDRRGVGLLMEASIQSIEVEDGRKHVTLIKGGREGTLLVDEILLATGKTPNLDLGLEAAGVAYTDKGVTVDDTMLTSNPNVYAAGDVAGPYMFTHAASYQGEIACHNMFGEGEKRHADYRAMPRCVFTSPEVATVGMTEHQAHEQGIDVRTGMSPIDVSDRALTTEQLDGFVKVLADESGRLIGGAIVAPRAGEMMQELALAIALNATAKQLAETVHAFPTFSEALAAACRQI
jgi:dihydrolipoamide dehydrogenase